MSQPFILRQICTYIFIIAISGSLFAQPISAQRKQLFDAQWRFNLGEHSQGATPEFDDSNWRQLDLPHDWSIGEEVNAKNPMGGAGGYFPAGIGWYRKSFVVPVALNGKKLSVYFEGVYMNAEVFINGKPLGVQPYGYTAFEYDLTPYLNYGKKNVIAVRVDNSSQVNSRWYSGSGIYRHVWLQVTNRIHLAAWDTRITTKQVTNKSAIVNCQLTVHNESSSPRSVQLLARVIDKSGKQVGFRTTRVVLPGNGQTDVALETSVRHPKLWSIAKPDLYHVQLSLTEHNRRLDQLTCSIGIRSITFSPQLGFQLNGESLKLNGGCLHHDNGCLGAAAYDRAEERKVEQLKEAGFNAVRTSHNPPSEAFLNACDRLGLLVIDESFDGWRKEKNKYDYARYFDQWWKSDIDAMVRRDRNHPSIIMWSIGNEIIERKEPRAVETAKMLAAEIKKLDTTRPVTSAMTTWDDDWTIFDPLMAVHDVAGYNYQLHRAEADHQRVPTRIIVQTESYPRDAFANWLLVTDHPYIIGDFVWTARDYLGESGIGRYYYPGEPEGQHWEREFFPWHGAYCGDIDLIGWRKPISHYRSMLYNDHEKLYLAVKEPDPPGGKIKETMWAVWPTWESWTWPGFENKAIQAEVYSRYPKVRLYLNNQLIGEQATTEKEQFKAIFPVPYKAGELKAVGVENGREKEQQVLKTAAEPTLIKLVADRQKIKANGEDLSFVRVEILDDKGVQQPNAENELYFSVSGPAVIAGVDNANLKDPAPYLSNQRKAWKGHALVVIKSTSTAGLITLTVKSNCLEKAVIHLNSK